MSALQRVRRRLPGPIRDLLPDPKDRRQGREPAWVDDVIPAEGSLEERHPEGPTERVGVQGAVKVLRRGIRESPELRAGLGFTLAMALASTAGRLLVPALRAT